MLAPIRVLESDIIGQIAAGEVIERPVSVVKELVENSIDAGSSRIEIEVKGDGTDYIRVTDNGTGIPAGEAELAFRRHATSKLTCTGDLQRLLTMGFRGEALPSIAAVGLVEMTTRTGGAIEGIRLQMEQSEKRSAMAAGCPVGTTVIVRSLFISIPARRKFLKSPAVELGAVGDTIVRLALANPSVSFHYLENGKPALSTNGTGKLINTVAEIYGMETARQMLPVLHRENLVEVSGAISRPTLTRGSRTYETLIVNGRYIKNRSLGRVVEEAYATLLPVHRYPVVVLHLQLDPALVDVNVHPAKLEVRFGEEAELKKAIREAVKGTLCEEGKVQTYNLKAPFAAREKVSPSRQPDLNFEYKESVRAEIFSSQLAEEPAAEYQPNPKSRRDLTGLVALGQLDASYILAQGPEGLYVVDQHAAHERILYERFSRAARKAKGPSQHLVVPGTIELNQEESTILVQNILVLADLGFVVEHFGGRTFLIRAVPAELTDEASPFFEELLSSWQEGSNPPPDPREKILKLMACRRAIKAHHRMSAAEMNHLLLELGQTEQPYTCPHGRPAVILLSRQELSRRFFRDHPA